MRPKPRSLPPGHSFPGRSSHPAAVRLSPGPRFQVPVSPALLSLPGPQLPFPQVLLGPQVLSLPEPRLLYLHGKQSLTRCMCQNSIKCVPVTVHLHRRTYIISILIPYVRIPPSRAGPAGRLGSWISWVGDGVVESVSDSNAKVLFDGLVSFP